MSRDVYAGDDDLNGQSVGIEERASTAQISLRADADPDVLQRVAAQLSFLNVAPLSFSLSRLPNCEVLIDIRIADCSDVAVDLVCRKLDRLTCVHEVRLEGGAG
jgi:hypothetical protein